MEITQFIWLSILTISLSIIAFKKVGNKELEDELNEVENRIRRHRSKDLQSICTHTSGLHISNTHKDGSDYIIWFKCSKCKKEYRLDLSDLLADTNMYKVEYEYLLNLKKDLNLKTTSLESVLKKYKHFIDKNKNY